MSIIKIRGGPICNMSGSFHLKDWKEAGETFQDMFSKLNIVRDRPTSIKSNREQPMRLKGKVFLFILRGHRA